MAEPDDLDEVSRRLARALQQSTDAPVDVGSLIAGSSRRAGARRRRRRVAMGVLSATVVGGLATGTVVRLLAPQPVSVVMLDAASSSGLVAGGPGGSSGNAASARPTSGSPGPSEPSGPSGSPAPTKPSGPSGQEPTQPRGGLSLSVAASPDAAGLATRLPRTEAGLVIVPDAALLTGELPGLTLTSDFDSGQYVQVPTTSTSACRAEPLGLQYAVGGRSLQWSQTAGPDWTFSNAVRVFSGRGSSDQVAWLRDHLDGCAGAWSGLQVVARDSVGEGSVLATSTTAVPGSVMVLGAVRSGRATSGFQLVVPNGAFATPAEALAQATTLGATVLGQAYDRLVTSGLGPRSAQDLSLAPATLTTTPNPS